MLMNFFRSERSTTATNSTVGPSAWKRKLTLIIGGATVSGVYVMVIVPAIRNGAFDHDDGIVALTERLGAVTAIIFVFGLVGYFVGRRSQTGVLVGVLLFASLFAAANVLGARRLSEQDEARRTLDALRTEFREVQLANLTAGRVVEDPADLVQRMQTTAARLAKSHSGDDRIVLEAAVQFTESMSQVAAQLSAATSGAIDAGMHSPEKLTREDVTRLRDLVNDAFQACLRMRIVLRAAEASVMHQARLKGLTDDAAGPRVAAFLRSARIETLLKLRECDVRIFEASIARIDVLRANWGRWTATDGMVAFSKNVPITDVTRFDAATDELNGASAEQRAILEQALTPPSAAP